MAMWCMMASPLLVSVDLRTISKWSRDLLQNPRLIAINQDTLGVQAKRILNVSLTVCTSDSNARVCMHAHTHTHTHTQMHMHMCVWTHKHTHTHRVRGMVS